jgi:hypothetical protein
VGTDQVSKEVTERYDGLLRSKSDKFSMRDFDYLDGVGDRAPVVIPKVLRVQREAAFSFHKIRLAHFVAWSPKATAFPRVNDRRSPKSELR